MKIFDDISIIEPFPAIYINNLEMIVIADLHLGYEGIAADQGIFIPKVQFKKIIKDVNEIISRQRAKRILINGDIKHEFSETSYHEFREVSKFFELLKKNFKEIIMIKGNHDNFIVRITKKYGVKLYDEVGIGNYFFIHGHKDRNLDDIKEKNIVLAHEHPSIVLFTEIGVKEKMKCFLYGNMTGKNIVLLPAFSYFAEGSSINQLPKNKLLSPMLKKLDVDEMKVIGIIEKEKYLVFPEIKKLRG